MLLFENSYTFLLKSNIIFTVIVAMVTVAQPQTLTVWGTALNGRRLVRKKKEHLMELGL